MCTEGPRQPERTAGNAARCHFGQRSNGRNWRSHGRRQLRVAFLLPAREKEKTLSAADVPADRKDSVKRPRKLSHTAFCTTSERTQGPLRLRELSLDQRVMRFRPLHFAESHCWSACSAQQASFSLVEALPTGYSMSTRPGTAELCPPAMDASGPNRARKNNTRLCSPFCTVSQPKSIDSV